MSVKGIKNYETETLWIHVMNKSELQFFWKKILFIKVTTGGKKVKTIF